MKSWMHPIATSLFGSLLITLPANALTPEQQVQAGINQYNSGQYRQAIQTWETALKTYQQAQDTPRIAILLENLARAYQQTGQGAAELQSWDQIIAIYTQQQNTAQVGRSLTEKAQALSRQGQTQTAIAILCGIDKTLTFDPASKFNSKDCAEGTAIHLLGSSDDLKTQAAALGSLGETYRLRGDYKRAEPTLQASLSIATKHNLTSFKAAALNSLGNTYSNLALNRYRRSESFRQQSETQAAKLHQAALAYDKLALQNYQDSLNNTQDPTAYLRGLTNLIPIYYRLGDIATARSTWQTAQKRLTQLPDSRTKAYALIDLATLQQSASDSHRTRLNCSNPEIAKQTEAMLQQSATIAQTIDDPRAVSYAFGELGRLYECQGQDGQALTVTRKAQLAAEQSLTAKDSLYLWEWQIGRILHRQALLKNSPQLIEQSISAYERAVKTLETIRSDILTANRDVQFDFRDTIDPIYRELVALKLNQETSVKQTAALPTQAVAINETPPLAAAVKAIDSLKLAELQNYFGNDCIIGFTRADLAKIGDPGAAVINTILFEDKTAVILTLPSGEQQLEWISETKSTITQTINNYRLGLESYNLALAGYDTQLAQQVYDWLIRRFEPTLTSHNIQTLVFVQDGMFRSVPMAALHDGQQFLIQKYSVAIAPSLSLVDPKSLDRENLRVLAMGFSQESTIDDTYFKALKQVPQELQDLAKQIPTTKQLLDSQFSPKSLQAELKKERYSILHIATHGKFGSDPEDTFLITGDDKERKLNLNDLDNFMRDSSKNTEPLDLLMLTACETAIGDDRSTLGLAGVAVQSGARSAIASLWQASDVSAAKLTESFYGQLIQPKMSRAKALQAAQLKMLEGGGELAHPYHWSAFVLVGNWL